MVRQRGGIRGRSWLEAALVFRLLEVSSPALAESGSTATFAAGPLVISAEESARAADPAAGAVDAVILSEETKRVELNPGRGKVWYHLRAKILSEAGLRLATIEIPNVDEETKVQEWWGRVLTPDGKVHKARTDKLGDRIDPSSGERSIGGTLPGAEVGSVVDWGYELSGARFPLFEIVRLQREWPVDRLTYRWLRHGESRVQGDTGGYRLQNGIPGIRVTSDKEGGLLRAEHVPASGHASLALWQLHPAMQSNSSLASWDKVVASFWDGEATQLEQRVSGFSGRPERLRAAMEAAHLAEGENPRERLRAAYAWIDTNVKAHASDLSGTPGMAARRVKGHADQVLTARAGTPIQRTLGFLSVARALGVDASLVLTTDPRVWPWDRYLLLIEQFSHALVEVRVPGEEVVFVAVGSGLPYGQVPAEVAGGKGLRVTKHRAEAIAIPAAARE